MLGTQLNSYEISGVGPLRDQAICYNPFSGSHCYSLRKQVSIPWMNSWRRYSIGRDSRRLKSLVVTSCSSSFGRFSGESDHNGDGRKEEDHNDDYVEASILMSETINHYWMLMNGFQKKRWESSLQLGPSLVESKDPRIQVNSIGPGFLRRFHTPTIFLKISCDGDFVLPIIVGENAVENLINSIHEDEKEDCPNQFQLTRNLIEEFGYEAKMVKITARVVNTYHARIIFNKPGEMNTFSVDVRPSDAINIAKRCEAPIYVNKQIVLADATRIPYGTKPRRKKSAYDVTLDSAADGPDLLSEELNMVRNMNLAAQEERYSDAAMWRDKLKKFRESK